MRRFPLAAVMIAVVSLTRPVTAQIQWHATLEEASAAAQRANQPMLLDFWAEWCAPCKVMDVEVYTNDEAVQAAAPFALVRIDFDKKPALARRYNVETMPTLVITDSYGGELFRYSGLIGAPAFSALLQALPHDVSEFNRLNRALDQHRNGLSALNAMGAQLRAAGLFSRSNEYYRRALQHGEPKPDSAAREDILTAMGLNYLDVNDGQLGAQTFEQCLKEFPRSQRTAEWTMNLGRARALAQSQDQARKYLEEALRRFPVDGLH
jgi:thioredoxin-like negative regulator of GroEL